jgi:hypothetical protein
VANGRMRSLKPELLVQYPLGQTVSGVKQHFYHAFFVFDDLDRDDLPYFEMICHGGDGAFFGVVYDEGYFGISWQYGAAPPSGPESADGGEGQQW